MSTIYLAGPVSLGGTCSDEQTAAFTATFAHEAQRLREEGHVVLNPCELDARPSWLDYMRATIPMLCEAEVVVALPRWRESRGASIEVGLAEALGIPVHGDLALP